MSKSITYLTPEMLIAALSAEQQCAIDAQAVAEIVSIRTATTEQLDEQATIRFLSLFVEWDENWRGEAGDTTQDEGSLCRSIHDATDTGQSTKPLEMPAMWTRIGNPLREFPERAQPLGTHDAYNRGAKVPHNGEKWTFDADSNVWEPGVYGQMKYAGPGVATELVEEAVGPEESSAEEQFR